MLRNDFDYRSDLRFCRERRVNARSGGGPRWLLMTGEPALTVTGHRMVNATVAIWGRYRHHGRMVLVLLLDLPGRHRALVSAETADLLVRMGRAKRLDRPAGDRQAMREARPPRR
jgi:hypothetical protein